MGCVVVAESIDPSGLEILAEAGTVHYDAELWRDAEQLQRWVQDADALVVRNQTRVDRSLLAQGAGLRVVGRLGVGLDNIDISGARARGVTVVSAQGANATAVAEYVFAVLFHFSRGLPLADAAVRQGRWDRSLGGRELYGKTLGLVGIGDIGQRVAYRARAFGLRVLAYDPWRLSTHLAVTDLGVELASLTTVLCQSDFVSVHVPLTEETRNLIDGKALSQMKPSAVVINTARGGVVDEGALLKAVRENRVSGAALDVRRAEPTPVPDPFASEPHVLLTPHIAGLTEEAGVRTAVMVAEDVIRALRGQRPLAAV